MGMAFTVFLAFLALYAAVRSSFVADRSRRVLVIKRCIGVFAFEKAYDANEVDRVCVRSTLNGSGLYVRFQNRAEAKP